MRDIKFRAWHKYDAKMYKVGGFSNHQWFLKGKTYPMPSGAIELQQFTGLKDKNGKGIYEGDIVKDQLGDVGEVYYDEAETSYMIHIGDQRYEVLGLTMPVSVIGNIHENPELLRGES